MKWKKKEPTCGPRDVDVSQAFVVPSLPLSLPTATVDAVVVAL